MILTLIRSESGSRFERTPGLKLDLCKLLCSDPRSYEVSVAWHCVPVCDVREIVRRGRGRGKGGVLRISPFINLPKAATLQPQPPPLLYHFNCYWFSSPATSTFQSLPFPWSLCLLHTFLTLFSFLDSLQLIFLSFHSSSLLSLSFYGHLSLSRPQFKQSSTNGESYPRLQ